MIDDGRDRSQYSDRNRMAAFWALGIGEQANAMRRLAAAGMSTYDIAAATQIAVEQVRRILLGGQDV